MSQHKQKPIDNIRKYLRLNRLIEVLCIITTTIATVFIAFATIHGCSTQDKMADISSDLKQLAQTSDSLENTRLKAELRPYLIIQLYPEPNKFGSQEYFKRDGNSQLYWEGLYNKTVLILPFKIKNVGKIPAVNIEAKYDSPSQPKVSIAMAYNNISPDDESSEFLHPWVDISTIVNDNKVQQFDIFLRITYKGLDEINSGNYCSLLKLTVMKKKNNVYQVIGNNFKFSCEN